MNAINYPGVRKVPSGIKTGWWSIEIPTYRPYQGTYSLFSYENLPPIQEHIDDDFKMLMSQPEKEHSLAEGCYNNGEKPDLGKLSKIAESIDLQLPKLFSTFIESIDLQKRVQSCTDCYLDVADFAIRTTGEIQGVMIHFLSDSQWCLHWYLHIQNSGDHFVAVSPDAYGFDGGGKVDNNLELADNDIWYCAPSFPEFIYRFWLENDIWFALEDKKLPLTVLQKVYVEHYIKLT
jgi:hypothetical protein